MADFREAMASETIRVSSRLFSKRKREVSTLELEVEQHESPSTCDEDISRAAKKQRRYREKIKMDPDKYKLHRESENKRLKEVRKNMTPEQKAHQLEQSNLRMQKCRARKKEAGLPLNKPKPQTRKTTEMQREQARLRKEKSRENMTPQRRTANNKRRREERAQKKMEQMKKETSPQPSTSTISSQKGYSSYDTKRKAVKKVLNTLPNSPAKFAEVIDRLTSVNSPRKIKAMADLGIHSAKGRKKLQYSVQVMEELEQEYKQIKKSRSKKHRKERSFFGKVVVSAFKGCKGKMAKIRRDVGISWKYLNKRCMNKDDDDEAKPRKNNLMPTTKKEIQDFFERGDISRTDPGQRNVSTKGLPKRFMEKTILESYKQFKTENDSIQISFSKFAKLRPKSVKTVKHNKLRACVCEYCANIELKIVAVNSFLAKKDLRHLSIGPSKYDLAKMTTCRKAISDSRACLLRTCNNCGVSAVRNQLQPTLDDHGDELCNWQVWKLEQQTYTDHKTGQQKTSSRRLLRLKEGPFDQVVTELEEEVDNYAMHLANAQWQHQQFAFLKQNLPEGWLLMCMDFGENMTCMYQDEVQGAHWSRQQITLHPVVAYYRCPEDEEVTTECFMFVSPDLKHDSHAVQHFHLKTVEHLRQRGLHFTKIIHFSDGCPSQYKCKTNFTDVSFAMEDIGVCTEKHFFGTRHGKGPCDAEIGVVKRLAFLAVRRRMALIADAQDLYRYGKASLTKPAQQHLHSHNRRTFVYVGTGEINRDRPDRAGAGVKPLKGSRSFHCFRGLGPYLVSTRDRTCFCPFCLSPGPDTSCTNEEFCGEWKMAVLSKQVRVGSKSGLYIYF